MPCPELKDCPEIPSLTLTVYITNFMQVDIVDPMTVVDKFSNILATPTIATGVNIKIILNNDLYVNVSSTGVCVCMCGCVCE